MGVWGFRVLFLDGGRLELVFDDKLCLLRYGSRAGWGVGVGGGGGGGGGVLITQTHTAKMPNTGICSVFFFFALWVHDSKTRCCC